jgi:hypothetical protein
MYVSILIVSIDPEFVKQITVKQFDNFVDSVDLHPKDEDLTLDMAMGDKWRELRRFLTPTFTSGKIKVQKNLSKNYFKNNFKTLVEIFFLIN